MAFQYHILKELVLHPRTPIYIIGKAFSYMSYLVRLGGHFCICQFPVSMTTVKGLSLQNAVKNFKSAYPRYDCPTIPAKEKR